MAEWDSDFELLPPEKGLTPDEQLDEAEEAVLGPDADVEDDEDDEEPDESYGIGWRLDPVSGQLVRRGNEPLRTMGVDTLRAWVEKCLLTPRGSSPIYTDAYGVDYREEVIGHPIGVEVAEILEDGVREALMTHDRIVGVQDFVFESDPDDDYLEVSFTVLTDNDEVMMEGVVLST